MKKILFVLALLGVSLTTCAQNLRYSEEYANLWSFRSDTVTFYIFQGKNESVIKVPHHLMSGDSITKENESDVYLLQIVWRNGRVWRVKAEKE